MTDSIARFAEVRHVPAVIVGSGVASLSVALGIDGALVMTRGALGSGSSRHAQGGVAAALGPDDNAAAHAEDTVAVSAGLADRAVAEAVTAAAAGRVDWLRALGAHFDLGADGAVALGREAGHRARRIVHAGGDATGAEIMRTLVAAVRARPDIEVLEGHDLVDLLRAGSRVVGVLAAAPDGALLAIVAPAVVLATGGIGGLYARTTNPPEVRGDGLAVAARAGALLADLEFVQFHPTALDIDADPAPLLTEALRGEGAVIIDETGERFMLGVHPDAELAPRDVLARAIWQRHVDGVKVYLDARAAIGARFPERFPSVWAAAQAAGLDPRVEPLPVTPAEHYFMGGIATDLQGRASLPGLWAVGEVAATGLHGANRLASNSLLEGMVLGAAAARSILARSVPFTQPLVGVPADALDSSVTAGRDAEGGTLIRRVRELMWRHVGLVRDAAGLQHALAQFEALGEAARVAGSVAARNAVTSARLIAAAALARTESRGAHSRVDHPGTDPAQGARSFMTPQRTATVQCDVAARRAA